MTTASDIIAFAFRKAGLLGDGQAMSGGDMSDALADLNDLVEQWQLQRFLVYHLVDKSVTSTGAQYYTIGASGSDIVSDPRPDRIEAAFQRQQASSPTPIDTPLEIIPAYEDYARIRAKTIGTYGWYLFYDSAWPQGKIYPWPVPAGGIYEIHVIIKEVLQRFTALNTTVNLPPGYQAALKWNLAQVLRASYGKKPSAGVNAMAGRALNALRLGNVQVPTLIMPRALRRTGRGYDYRSDSSTTA